MADRPTAEPMSDSDMDCAKAWFPKPESGRMSGVLGYKLLQEVLRLRAENENLRLVNISRKQSMEDQDARIKELLAANEELRDDYTGAVERNFATITRLKSRIAELERILSLAPTSEQMAAMEARVKELEAAIESEKLSLDGHLRDNP